jgi:OOP family OmpA-OmpF porin
VAKFLHEVGNIPMDKISVKGFGKEKPVASNETKEGRALNRRIDVLIVNEEPVVQ